MTVSELLSHFVANTRDNGKRFYTLADNCPKDVQDLVMDCHEGELPNDWRYDVIVSLLHSIKDTDTLDSDTISDIVDGEVEVYNSCLAQWLADDASRSEYIDEARIEFGDLDDDIFRQIACGQYVAIQTVMSEIMSFLELTTA